MTPFRPPIGHKHAAGVTRRGDVAEARLDYLREMRSCSDSRRPRFQVFLPQLPEACSLMRCQHQPMTVLRFSGLLARDDWSLKSGSGECTNGPVVKSNALDQ